MSVRTFGYHLSECRSTEVGEGKRGGKEDETMLENPMDSSVKRYAPPNQRNRAFNRRKSTDESERASNFHSSDGEINLGTGFQRAPSIDSSDGGSNKSAYESFHPRLIALNGCCASEASQLLHQRWKAAIHCYNDPTIDLTERQVMYTESASSAWGSFRLPHQLMSAPQMDFLAELQQAIDNSQRKAEEPKY